MRSIVAILLLLSVVGVLFTPGAEDDLSGTPPESLYNVSSSFFVKSGLKSLEPLPVIYPASAQETAHMSPGVMRC